MTALISIPAGRIEYSKEEAMTDIDAIIAMLNEAKADGATHVVLESGNYRGAKWQTLPAAYEWVDE